MICEKCHQRPASVHMKQIINGEKTELYLCQECVENFEKPLSFEQFFQSLLDFFEAAPAKVQPHEPSEPLVCCPQCGQSYENFKKTGKLGCGECYQTFRREMDQILKNIQGSNRHEGKFPHKSGTGLLNKRRVDQLKAVLSKAIESEEYEEAAKIRDQIRELEVRE